MAGQPREVYVEEGIDPLSLVTPVIEKRRQIVIGTVIVAAAVAAWAIAAPRLYKAEMLVVPVGSSRSVTGGLAALTGAMLQTGNYQLTPSRMVELLKSRVVLSGVGFSQVTSASPQRVIDRVIGRQYELGDAEHVASYLSRLMSVRVNNETGTIAVGIVHRDSALARLIASRVVDSASQIYVRTSRAQAQQLRLAQEDRVSRAAVQLATAENRLREFDAANRVAPSFSRAGLERERLAREIRFAEQIYTQAVSDRDGAFARELEATPTVVVQDSLPVELPRVRKRVVMKTAVAGISSFILLCLAILIGDLARRRLQRPDPESARFRRAVSTLPLARFRRRAG